MNSPNMKDATVYSESGELFLCLHRLALAADQNEVKDLQSWTANLWRSPLGQAREWSVLHVQLSKTQHLNSLGISYFHWLTTELQRRSRPLRISIASESVLRVARFCRFQHFADLRQLDLAGEPGD